MLMMIVALSETWFVGFVDDDFTSETDISFPLSLNYDDALF